MSGSPSRLVATSTTGASPSARGSCSSTQTAVASAQWRSSRTTIAGADERSAPASESRCSHRRSAAGIAGSLAGSTPSDRYTLRHNSIGSRIVGSASPCSTPIPAALARFAASSASRVLPIPASPTTQHDVRAAATRRVHRRLQRRQLALAPDDTIVARRDRRGHRLQLPVASETGAAYRPDVQRSIEAPELPFAEVGHLEPGRQVVADEYGRRLRHQHLPAPRRGHDPGGAIGPRPEVVVGGRGGRRRVQADAAAQRHPAGEPALTLDGRADRCDRVGEHRHETVTGVFDNFAPGRGDRRPDDPVVLGEFGTHRVRLAFPARRGALDVGEQEGDRPSRTNRHRGDDRPPAWSAAAEYSARPDQLNRRSTSPRSGSDRR